MSAVGVNNGELSLLIVLTFPFYFFNVNRHLLVWESNVLRESSLLIIDYSLSGVCLSVTLSSVFNDFFSAGIARRRHCRVSSAIVLWGKFAVSLP